MKLINKNYQWLAAAVFGLLSFLTIKEILLPFVPPVSVNEIAAPANQVYDPFVNLNLEAKAVLVFAPDEDKILFAKNPNTPLPIASLTKVMTALASERTLASSVQFGGHSWQLSNLINYTLISSSNTAAAALATAAVANGHSLIETMNDLAVALGLTATHFDNTTGLDLANGEPGSVSSATDIVHLFVYILKNQPTLLAATRYSELEVATLDEIRYRVVNTNKITTEIPGLLASKTGYTEAAQGSLVVIFDRGLNEPIILVVLGSSFEGRFADVKKLISATYVYDY